MVRNPPDDQRSTAVSQLSALGLSEYAARTFVALVTLDGATATATDVSEVSKVPRTRVYDAADELAARGLVEVEHTRPRRFSAVSVETTRRRLEAEFTRRVTLLESALESLQAN